MVISRSDAKKRRKEGDALEDSLQGSPKRTKVHAQRKFAQGSSNVNSPALTPVKDKDKIKTNGAVLSPELISSKRPKTEDFLTFLCFRGTPILPPQLDFFNVASIQDNQDEEQGSSNGDYNISRPISVASTIQKPQRAVGMDQAMLVPGMVKKNERSDIEMRKRPSNAVQALRKKYQEQRLAKQKSSTLSRLAKKVKGKNMVRTRASTLREESQASDLRKFQPKRQLLQKTIERNHCISKNLKSVKCAALRRLSVRGQPKLLRELENPTIRRGGLRSGGQLPPGSDEGLKTEKPLNNRVPPKEQYGKSKTKVFTSSLPDFSSDDDQPLMKKIGPLEKKRSSSTQQLARKMVKRIVKSTRPMHPQMVTRSRQQIQNETSIHHYQQRISKKIQPRQLLFQQKHLQQQRKDKQQGCESQTHFSRYPGQQSLQVVMRESSRPSRKTKEAASLYMELLGKKLITCDCDADEDTASVDSFPELPYFKRNEQRGMEMKAKYSKDLEKQESFECKETDQQTSKQKEEKILNKKDISVKKESQNKKGNLQRKENFNKKRDLKSKCLNSCKVKKSQLVENKGRSQKSKDVDRKTQIVKRSLRISKEESSDLKVDRIQKRTGATNVSNAVHKESKLKTDVHSKSVSKDPLDFYNLDKKFKGSDVSHSLRSRSTSKSQMGESEREDVTHSRKLSSLRRSLRNISREIGQSSENVSLANQNESDDQKPCIASEHLVKKSVVRSSRINLDLSENKFSDSGEEPLQEVALKKKIVKKLDEVEIKREISQNKKSFVREGKNVTQSSYNLKEKSKFVTKVTRANASFTEETTIRVKEEKRGSVSIKKVLKRKSLKYSKVTLSTDKKIKQEVKKEKLPDSKLNNSEEKSNLGDLFVKNVKSSEKIRGKLCTENKNTDNETLKTLLVEESPKRKITQKKKKEKKSDKNTVSSESSEDSRKLESMLESKSKINVNLGDKAASCLKPKEEPLLEETPLSYHMLKLSSAEKGKGLLNNQNFVSDTGNGNVSKKGKLDSFEEESESPDHIPISKKCLVRTECEFRRKSLPNSSQKRGTSFSKKQVTAESPRRSNTACPKDTELELQRRLSMVCLKEADIDHELKQKLEEMRDNSLYAKKSADNADTSQESVVNVSELDILCGALKKKVDEVKSREAVPLTNKSSHDRFVKCSNANYDLPVQSNFKKATTNDSKYFSSIPKDAGKCTPLGNSISCKVDEANVADSEADKNESNSSKSTFMSEVVSKNYLKKMALKTPRKSLLHGGDEDDDGDDNDDDDDPNDSLSKEQNLLYNKMSPKRNSAVKENSSTENASEEMLSTHDNDIVSTNNFTLRMSSQNYLPNSKRKYDGTALNKVMSPSKMYDKNARNLLSRNSSVESLDQNNLIINQSARMYCCVMPDMQEERPGLGTSELYDSKINLSNDLGNIGQDVPLKLNSIGMDLGKANLDTNSVLSHDSGLRDMKVKEKLNMSAERVEKWLSENCTGNLEHKKDCSLYDKNICNCSLSVIDDDLCLSDYGNDKLTIDCISGDCERDEESVKMSADICPFENEFIDMKYSHSESLSCMKPSVLKDTNLISSESQISCEKNTMKSTLKERPISVLEQNNKSDDSNSLERPVEDPLDISEKNTEGMSQLPERSASPHDKQPAALGRNDPPLIASNNLGSTPFIPSNETANEKGIKSDILNVLQSEMPSLLEDLKNKSVQESTSVLVKEKVSPKGPEKMGNKEKETNKSEVSPNLGAASKLSSERLEKKSIFQKRRSFTHKVKERKGLTPSANAFSPENESSVYAFETEPDSPPISTPFRRRARDSRTSSTTTSKSEEDWVKITEEDTSPNNANVFSSPNAAVSVEKVSSNATINKTSTNVASTFVVEQSSSPGCTRSSASIAVQVNLDSETVTETIPMTMPSVETTIPEAITQKSMECSTQTDVAEEEESDGHLFYIPLQQTPTPTTNTQLIQGVAVKLGTEGPTGPNQRVIMRAKLVTKPPNFSRPATAASEAALGMKRTVLGSSPPRPTGILTLEQKTASIGQTTHSSLSGMYPPVVPVQPTTRVQPKSIVSENKSDALPSVKSEVKISSVKNINKNSDGSENPFSKAVIKDDDNSSASESMKIHSDVKEKGKTQNISRTSSVLASSTKSSGTERLREPRSSNASAWSSVKANFGCSKRNVVKGKTLKTSDPSYTCFPTNVAKFPSVGSPGQMVEAPVFYPTEKEFQDPLEYIDRIRPVAETFGLCRVVPPQNFRPECKVSDDMRFTAYNQYVHKMFCRWGPNVKEMMAIKKYLLTQSVSFLHPPLIGGMEVDLPRLYQTVQSFGGLKEVIEKKRWQRVADGMKIPKSAQDRVTKLDDIYCKYLLPYDTLSPDERQKLLDEVEEEWKLRQSRPLSQESCSSSDSPEEELDTDVTEEECIVKGRNMPLNAFYRIARNTMAMWFRQPEPSASEVEQEFWKHVMSRNSHVCVHSGSIDSSGCGYGFPCSKNSPFARHPWNLKVLTNNSGSVLRSIGPIMGVTVPTLHVGMLFTTCCWYRDPHGLPWIEYLHTGANKIWYGIPDSYSFVFQSAMNKLIPRYCKNKTIWLPSDTAMVPPSLLVNHGVSLCHTVQEPGQFIIVFPRAFTSSICTGYLVSESVYFAQPHWLLRAEEVFKDIQDSCEPSMFSLERLLFGISSDARSHIDVLKQILPMILRIKQKELDNRKVLFGIGLKTSERLPLPDANAKRRKIRPTQEEEGDYECEICRANLFVSLVTNSHEEGVYCLPHAIELLSKKRNHLKFCKLMYTYDQAELNDLLQKLQDKIEVKSQKKSSQGKQNTSLQK